MEVNWSNTSVQLLIEAGLSTETRQDQDEWMSALAHQAATDVYESTDDYDQIKFVRDANQHHWLQDCKTLEMTQRDLNYFTKWVDDVKAAHTSRTSDGDFGGTPTQLNFKQSVASDLIRRHIINVKVYVQDNVQQR